jgi:uncharacterized protein YbjT (DUF2867 family)
MTISNILVIGGTGKTGRRVASRLTDRGLPVRIGSRAGSPPFDWDDPETWPAALAGADRVYLSYFPDVAIPGSADVIESVTRLAVAAGVRRIVLLSGRGEAEAEECERRLAATCAGTGTQWTVVRASWFNQNFSEGFIVDLIRDGVVALPAGDIPEPFVDADDIADVAVAALTEDGHAGEVYEVTGPRAYTFAEAVDEIAKASGRSVEFVPVPLADFAAELRRLGLPSDIAWLLEYLFREVLDGRNVQPTDGVRRALGREPRDLLDYVRDTAATGVWNA